MSKKYSKIILISSIFFFVIVVSVFVFFFLKNNKQEIIKNNDNIENIEHIGNVENIEKIQNEKRAENATSMSLADETEKEIQISVSMIVAEKTVILKTKAGNSFYDALVEAKEKNLIDFAGENYPALGFFLTDIGSLHSNKDQDLMYYINGKEAYLGVSSYKLKDGDILKWQLE